MTVVPLHCTSDETCNKTLEVKYTKKHK